MCWNEYLGVTSRFPFLHFLHSSYFKPVFQIPFTHFTGFLSKSKWVLPLLKLRSRYETDCMMIISCEGYFSLVLLGMFRHPYPTLVVTKILRSHSPFGSDFRILPSAPIQRCSVAVYYPTDEDCIIDCPNRLVSVYLDKRIPSNLQKDEDNQNNNNISITCRLR